jgi:hypothetical protein
LYFDKNGDVIELEELEKDDFDEEGIPKAAAKFNTLEDKALEKAAQVIKSTQLRNNILLRLAPRYDVKYEGKSEAKLDTNPIFASDKTTLNEENAILKASKKKPTPENYQITPVGGRSVSVNLKLNKITPSVDEAKHYNPIIEDGDTKRYRTLQEYGTTNASGTGYLASSQIYDITGNPIPQAKNEKNAISLTDAGSLTTIPTILEHSTVSALPYDKRAQLTGLLQNHIETLNEIQNLTTKLGEAGEGINVKNDKIIHFEKVFWNPNNLDYDKTIF